MEALVCQKKKKMKEVGKNKNTHSKSKLTVSQYESFVLNPNPRFYVRFFFGFVLFFILFTLDG